MWGQSWGQMIWGQAAVVPAVGFWGAMLLGAALGAWGVRRLRGPRPRVVGTIVLCLALLLPISARALPFTFTNGTVADATQVNANFAAVVAAQSIGPTTSSNMIDLEPSGACPQSSSGIALQLFIDHNGVGNSFSIATGQTLILTTVSAGFSLGTGSANHAVLVAFYRFGSAGGSPFETTIINLDAAGGGSASLNLGSGTAFGPGTKLCVLAQDITNFNNPNPTFANAHGYLTTQ
jgi:hypothetical protein